MKVFHRFSVPFFRFPIVLCIAVFCVVFSRPVLAVDLTPLAASDIFPPADKLTLKFAITYWDPTAGAIRDAVVDRLVPRGSCVVLQKSV
jgi:hypothetical protein